MSEVYIFKSVGDRTHPCGTPKQLLIDVVQMCFVSERFVNVVSLDVVFNEISDGAISEQ